MTTLHSEDSALLGAQQHAQEYVGHVRNLENHNSEVTRSAISRWTRAIGDRNRLWFETEFCRQWGYRGLLAPPLWLYTVNDTISPLPIGDLHSLIGETDWQFVRPVYLGDRVECAARVVSADVREGRFAGRMLQETTEFQYATPVGEPLATAQTSLLRFSRSNARQIGKYAAWEKRPYTPAELYAIEDAYVAEEVRDAPRYWEDVASGDDLQPCVRGPLTSEDVLQFVSSTRPVKAFGRFTQSRTTGDETCVQDPKFGMWESWSASMLRDDIAQLFGFPFAHDAGIDRIAWLCSAITNWSGPTSFLKRLKVRLTAPVVYGDAIWINGTVAKKTMGRSPEVEIRMTAHTQREVEVAHGYAVVQLPSRNHDAGLPLSAG